MIVIFSKIKLYVAPVFCDFLLVILVKNKDVHAMKRQENSHNYIRYYLQKENNHTYMYM